jgi:hypothetical protein
MHVPTVHRLTRRSWLCALALAWSLIVPPALAQPFQLRLGAPQPAKLTPPQLDLVTGPAAARLEQAHALAADKNWDEAVDTYRDLADEDEGRVVELDDSRFVSVPSYCNMQIARLPADGLAAYRRRVDPLAERWYQEGIAEHDEAKLRRVVDESFCSSSGDDALLALGEFALERADIESARHAWEQISPMLRGPNGRPLWLELRDIDVDANWPEIERRWRQRPQASSWLAYPDTNLSLADVRARLILASIRGGELERAAFELEVFRRMHPDAIGRLGGQDGNYVAALERLLKAARDWPATEPHANWLTFAATQGRSGVALPLGPILGPSWAAAVKLETRPPAAAVARRIIINGGFAGGGVGDTQQQQPQQSIRESQRPLSCFPIVVNDMVLYSDDLHIRAVHLKTGKPAITSDGVIHREQAPGEPTNRIRLGLGGVLAFSSAHGVPRFTLTAVNNIVYGRLGPPATTRVDARDTASAARLIGVDLARDGLLAFHARPSHPSSSFDGAPVGDGRRIWIAMRHSDITPQAYVYCYDATSGIELWRTSIGAADTPAAGRGDEVTHDLLTMVGDRIFFSSNLGLVAALDARDGSIAWLHRYERASGDLTTSPHATPIHVDREPSPCLYHNGIVFVAPADATTIFALDALTGQRVWSTDKLTDALHLLGVVGKNLIVSGNRLSAVDVRSGANRYTWPESEHAGIRGMGRGLLAGNEVFWPTREDIYVFDAATGAQSRSPISLRSMGSVGANLAAAGGQLIVASHDKLLAFGPNVTQRQPNAADAPVRTSRSTPVANQAQLTTDN